MSHAAEVTRAFFTDVGAEEDGGVGGDICVLEGGGEGEQGSEAGAVVAGSRAVDDGSVFAWGAVGCGWKDGVEVGGE
jgi:hypothetical protein